MQLYQIISFPTYDRLSDKSLFQVLLTFFINAARTIPFSESAIPFEAHILRFNYLL